MSEIKTVVKETSQDLHILFNKLHANVPASIEPSIKEAYDTWECRAELSTKLSATLPLFELRDVAKENLCNLRDNALRCNTSQIGDKVRYGAIDAPMALVRVVAVDAYLAACWSVYDRLSDVIGRLVGDDGVLFDKFCAHNPKLTEQLMEMGKPKSFAGFGLNNLLNYVFAENVYFSYRLRNAYLHDGGMINTRPILAGLSMGEAFCVSQDIADAINEDIGNRIKSENVIIARAGDLVEQLMLCSDVIDRMFVALLRYSCNAFRGQVTAFSECVGVICN